MRITEDRLASALAGDWTGMRAAPKTDLHAHVMLSAPFAAYQRIAAGAIPAPPRRFSGFEAFDRYVREHVIVHFKDLAIRQEIVHAALQHMADDGVVRAEVSFDALTGCRLGMSWGRLAEQFSPLLREYHSRIRISPDLGINRQIPSPDWPNVVREALHCGFFEGVDIYGSEAGGVSDMLVGVCREARALGLRVKLHTGEQSSAAQMRADLAAVRPDAVQHGIVAAEDAVLLHMLARQRIRVNVCPYGNWALSYVASYREHPIRRMFDAGVRVTINTDDYAVFGRSVSEEYVRLFEAGVFSAAELEQIRNNGF